MSARIRLTTTMVLLAFFAGSAAALIETPYPLERALADADSVFTLKIDKVNAAETATTASVQQVLKGTPPTKSFTISLAADKDEGRKQWLARIEPGTSLVMFVTEQKGNQLGLLFANGSWFQVVGEKTLFGLKWKYTHPEIYLRRTFAGTTDELTQVATDALAGKKKPPPLDEKLKPGLGPELARKK